jgi:glycosyltransferase involved in cell wall biosynthesis
MRIAHFLQGRCNPDSANGVDKTVYFLSRAQAALGHEVAIFCISEKPPLPIDGVEVRNYSPGWQPFAKVDRLVVDLRSWNPTVVHLHSLYIPANITLANELRRIGIPYVVTPHGALASALIRRKPHLKLPYKYLFELRCLNRAAFVHSVGDSSDTQQYGVRVPIVLAPNGFDLASIPSDLASDAIVRRWPHAAGRRIALFVGKLKIEQKGLDLLLRAFHQAASRAPQLVLVVVGPDWQGGLKSLERLAGQLGIRSDVFFWGPSFGKDKFDLLASADIFMHTSRWEGFPFSLIEALATGRPCIVTPAADPLGLVARSGAGRVVDPEVCRIAEAISELVALNRSELLEHGIKGRTLVEQELGWRTIAQTIQTGYTQYCMPNKDLT